MKYEYNEQEPIKASEPMGAYATAENLVSIKSKIVSLVNRSEKVSQLQQCLEILSGSTAPCVYSDEEFKGELTLSEASGFVDDSEFKSSCKEKWGVEL